MLSSNGFVDTKNKKTIVDGALPPHNEEAEMAVIGGLLIDPDMMLEADRLKPSDFFLSKNQRVFQVLLDLYRGGKGLDLLVIQDELERLGWLDDLGGPSYITDLIASTPTSMHVPYYAEIVRESSVRRQMIDAGTQIVQMAWDRTEGNSTSTLMNGAMESLTEINADGHEGGIVSIGDASWTFLDDLKSRCDSDSRIMGLSTGIKALDKKLGGLLPDQNYLLAGRPGMGKSSLALSVMLKLAEQGHKMLMFSLEMGERKVIGRVASQMTGIPYWKIRDGVLSQDEQSQVAGAVTRFQSLPIYIDCTPLLTMETIRSRAQRAAIRHGVDLVVIDHMNIVQEEKQGKAYEESSRKADKLMALPKQLGVPVLALLQLSRQVENRAQKIPEMSDLRDTGKWEENADAIMFVYRDEYYNADTDQAGVVDLILAKNRDGEPGTVNAFFRKDTMQFLDLDIKTQPLDY